MGRRCQGEKELYFTGPTQVGSRPGMCKESERPEGLELSKLGVE